MEQLRLNLADIFKRFFLLLIGIFILTTSASGNVFFKSAGDIINRGSTIAAGGNILLDAARDVRLEAVTTSAENSSSRSDFSGITYRNENTKWNITHSELPEVLADGSIVIKSGRDVYGQGALVRAGEDVLIDAGRDVTFTADVIDKYWTQNGSSIGVSFFGSKAIDAAVTGEGDVLSLFIGDVPIANNLHALAQSKNGWEAGANLTRAGVSTYNTIVGAAGVVNNGGGELGFANVAGMTRAAVEFNSWKNEQNWQELNLSLIEAGRDVSITAGNDILLIGGTSVLADRDIRLDAARDIIIRAAEARFSNESQNWGVSAGVNAQTMTADVGGYYAQQRGSGINYTLGTIRAGNQLSATAGNNMAIIGAHLGGDTIFIDAGKNLIIESVQNTRNSEGFNASGSVGFSATSILSLSLSGGYNEAERRWADDPTTIIGKSGVTVKAGDTTTLKGGIVYAENGNLLLDSPTLIFEDLHNVDKSLNVGGGFSMSFNGGNTGAKSGGIPGMVGFNYASTDKEGITRATVGAGTIVTKSDLSELNRDLARAQEITKDEHTGFSVVIPIISGEGVKQDMDSVSAVLEKLRKTLPEELSRQAEKLNEIRNKKIEQELAEGKSETQAVEAGNALISDKNVAKAAKYLADSKYVAEYFAGKGETLLDPDYTAWIESNLRAGRSPAVFMDELVFCDATGLIAGKLTGTSLEGKGIVVYREGQMPATYRGGLEQGLLTLANTVDTSNFAGNPAIMTAKYMTHDGRITTPLEESNAGYTAAMFGMPLPKGSTPEFYSGYQEGFQTYNGFTGSFLNGTSDTIFGIGGIGDKTSQGGLFVYDVSQTLFMGDYGAYYDPASDYYKYLRDNPFATTPSALREEILIGGLKAERNLLTLGAWDTTAGFIHGYQTGDYSDAQMGSLNMLMLNAGLKGDPLVGNGSGKVPIIGLAADDAAFVRSIFNPQAQRSSIPLDGPFLDLIQNSDGVWYYPGQGSALAVKGDFSLVPSGNWLLTR